MLAVTIESVSKVFANGHRALDSVSCTVAPGEAVVILGSNGAGKSTLLRSVVGLVRPTSGQVSVGGVDVTKARGRELSRLRTQVGFVFQTFDLVEGLTAFHNVLHGALGRRGGRCVWPSIAPENERVRGIECLDRVGLAHLASRRVSTLSGGEKQRVAIARMLMQGPSLVLADEPIASLDPRAGREILDLLWALQAAEGLTILCSLHQPELARRYADRLVGMRNGRIVFDSAVCTVGDAEFKRLYEQPATPIPAHA